MLPCVPPREDRHELPHLRTAEPVEGMLRRLVDPVTGFDPGTPPRAACAGAGADLWSTLPACWWLPCSSWLSPAPVSPHLYKEPWRLRKASLSWRIARHGGEDETHFRELEMTLPGVAAGIPATIEERRAAL